MTRKETSMIQSMGTLIDCEDKNGRVQTLFQWGNVDKESDSTVSIITGQQNHQEEIYTLELRQTIHPWLAAMDYMKYVYLGGLILILICLSIDCLPVDILQYPQIHITCTSVSFSYTSVFIGYLFRPEEILFVHSLEYCIVKSTAPT